MPAMRLAPRLLLLLLAAAPAARAQTAPTPGACALGTADAVIDIGDVSARVFNTGGLFYGGGLEHAYYVPKSSGRSPIYAAGLWIAGKVGGELRVAGGTYGEGAMEYNLWPGPLGPDARPVDPATCAAYDRIYTVSRGDIATFYRTGVATDDLRDWPWRLGAPVLDGDGNPANYDLARGDQPALRGEQTAWALMNDVGNAREEAGARPLGVEVRMEASAFLSGRLSQTTTYRYTITNRTRAVIDSAYVGLWADPDLGDGSDDYVGTDTTRGMVYVYNAYDRDNTGGGTSYGLHPPALGFQLVSGPVGLPNGRDDDRDGTADEPGERLGITAGFGFINADPSIHFAQTRSELGRQFRGLWNDGTTIRAFGTGYQQTQGAVTRFMFAGDPVRRQPWTERDPGAGLPSLSPGNRYSLVSTGPFRLGPGQSETVVFAMPFAQGADNLDSVTALRRVALAVSSAFEAGYLEPQRVAGFAAPPPDLAVRLGRPSPNPFGARTVVRYQIPTGTPMRATLLDARGRRLAVLFDGPTEAPTGELVIEGAGLAAGVYRVHIVVPGGERTLTLVRAR